MQHARAGQERQGALAQRNSHAPTATKRALLDAQLSESLSDETCDHAAAGLLGSLLEHPAGSPRPRKIRVRGSPPDGGTAFGGHPAAPAVAAAAVPELSLASLLVAARLASGAGERAGGAACSLLPSTQATLAATTASVVAAEMLAAASRPAAAAAAAPSGGSGSPVSVAPGALGVLLPPLAVAQQSTDAAATPQPAPAATAAGLQLPGWLCEKSAELAASQAICRASLLSTTAALARLRSPRSPVIAAAARAHTSCSPALRGAATAGVMPPSNRPVAQAAGEDASSCSSTPRAQAAGESPGALLAAAAAQLAAEAADAHVQQVQIDSHNDKVAGSKTAAVAANAQAQQQQRLQHHAELCDAQPAVVGAAPGGS